MPDQAATAAAITLSARPRRRPAGALRALRSAPPQPAGGAGECERGRPASALDQCAGHGCPRRRSGQRRGRQPRESLSMGSRRCGLVDHRVDAGCRRGDRRAGEHEHAADRQHVACGEDQRSVPDASAASSRVSPLAVRALPPRRVGRSRPEVSPPPRAREAARRRQRCEAPWRQPPRLHPSRRTPHRYRAERDRALVVDRARRSARAPSTRARTAPAAR